MNLHELMSMRIVCAGASIIDGHTLLLLIEQSLEAAGRPVPTMFNAGVGGDRSENVLARLDRDVLSHRPDLVTLLVGANDSAANVPAQEYEANVGAIAQQLTDAKISLILMTPTPKGAALADQNALLANYDAAIHRIADRHSLRVAEVRRVMMDSGVPEREMLEADLVHIRFPGYRLIARALLDTMGHAEVPVIDKLRLKPIPGIIREWTIRVASTGDSAWKSYALPEPDPIDHWWQDQERQRGFAMNVARYAGAGPSFEGLAEVQSPTERRVTLHTGAGLQSIRLNDQEIWRRTGWTGFHAGKERIPATLRAGANTIAITFDGTFFLSVNDA